MLEPGFSTSGPVIDRTSIELLDADGGMTVTGWASPDATITLDVVPETGYGPGTPRSFTTTATSEGTFSLEIELTPGISRLVIRQQSGDVTSAGLVGNTFEVGGSVVQGTALYVASVPPGE